ncbi:hypothetical protein PSHT_04745 [Puccinia striiformis]|uniref:Hydrophobin n=2 Tax=Puccinia striiformis TaxID=27350 RepID=A0A2S4V4U2_9BASI|nr:hypothetical protein PSTT_10317 [Puccinia striiformis]POW19364.1 hypothetical protein PSHT_04745 [Puccinia striiformis]
MQSYNIFAISIVLLIQGRGVYSQSFGCSGNVKDHPLSGCVKHVYRQSKVNIMIAPWDNAVGAYDCSNTKHKKPSCCSNESVRNSENYRDREVNRKETRLLQPKSPGSTQTRPEPKHPKVGFGFGQPFVRSDPTRPDLACTSGWVWARFSDPNPTHLHPDSRGTFL